MARIRTIKPEFPHSESMGNCCRDTRLTFILMWTLADDEGRLRANPKLLASLLYPYDSDGLDVVSLALEELCREGCVTIYSGEDGARYAQINNWASHQRIDKPSASRFPAPEFVEGSRGFLEDSGRAPGRKGKEGIGKEEEDMGPPKANQNPNQKVAPKKKFVPPTEEEARAYFQSRVQEPHASKEASKFWNYHKSRDWVVGKVGMIDWRAAARYWLSNTNAPKVATLIKEKREMRLPS